MVLSTSGNGPTIKLANMPLIFILLKLNFSRLNVS
jgi:hypothetical protein